VANRTSPGGGWSRLSVGWVGVGWGGGGGQCRDSHELYAAAGSR